jgi:hypothetical protein
MDGGHSRYQDVKLERRPERDGVPLVPSLIVDLVPYERPDETPEVPIYRSSTLRRPLIQFCLPLRLPDSPKNRIPEVCERVDLGQP